MEPGGGGWVGRLFATDSWVQLWPPAVWAGAALLAVCYLLAVAGPARRYFPGTEPARRAQAGWFLGGLLTLAIAYGTPLWILGQRDSFTAHMVELSLETMVAVPMLLTGTPDFLVRPIWEFGPTRSVLKLFTHPLMALFLFTVAFSLWNLPALYDPSLLNGWLQALELVGLGVLAVGWWWPVWSPLPERPRLTGGALLIYVLAAGAFLIPVLFFLVLTGQPGYPVYGHRAEVFGFTPAMDMQVGGILFRVFDTVSLGVAAVNGFMYWADRGRYRRPGASGSEGPPPVAPIDLVARRKVSGDAPRNGKGS